MADEEIPINILEIEGDGLWDPQQVLELLQEYYPDETPEEIGSRIEQAFVQAQGDWEPGLTLILTIEGAPYPISLGLEPIVIGSNLYTWSWAGHSLTDPDFEYSDEDRNTVAEEFVQSLTQQQEEVPFNLDDAVGIDEEAAAVDEQLDMVEQEEPPSTGYTRIGDRFYNPTTGDTYYAKGKLRNGLPFKPNRVYYGE